METNTISRRQFVKGAGALIVSFNFFGAASRLLAQSATYDGDPEATSLDSWLWIAPDGTVTVFTSKVDLGTGMVVAAIADRGRRTGRAVHEIHMETGDTSDTIDQAATVGSRTLERGAHNCVKPLQPPDNSFYVGFFQLEAPVENHVVKDGVVSVGTIRQRRFPTAELIGGKHFDLKIAATGAGRDMNVAPDAKAKNPKDYKIVAHPCHEWICLRNLQANSFTRPTCAYPTCSMDEWCVRRW